MFQVLRKHNFTMASRIHFCASLVVVFLWASIQGLRVGAAAVEHCRACGGVPTPSTTILDFDHITTVTQSIGSLPTEFHYSDYLYLSDFQLLKNSSFAANTTDANACSSGKIALLSTGGGSMAFGTPDSTSLSNYRYMNLSSMRVTNIEDTDVYVSLQFIPPFAHGGLSFYYSTYEFQIPKGSSKLLIDGLEQAGLTYVQTLLFTCNRGHSDSDAAGAASVAFDDVAIVVPHSRHCGHSYTSTPTSTGCPMNPVTSLTACTPAAPTATTQKLTFDDISTGPSGSISMPAHYKGLNFSPKAVVVRSSGKNTYGSKRSSGPNALLGVPYQGEGFDNSIAISFSSEQTASFTIQGFHVTVFNISNPSVPPSQSATLTLTLFSDGYYPNTVSISVPVGEEMYKVNATAASDGFVDTYAVRFQASFDDSTAAGLIIDSLQIERPYYPDLSETCRKGLRTLTFDDISTSCGRGDIAAPATYHDFRLHYPTSVYEELSPWNVTAASIYAANSSEALVAGGSRNILYGTTGTNGPSSEFQPFANGVSVYLDETHSLKSAGNFDFDLIALNLGLDEITTVPDAIAFYFVMTGFDKCGNQISQMSRYYVPFPGTGGSVTQFSAGMFAELNFVGLRKVQFSATAATFNPDGYPALYLLPFWIDSVEYRRSG